MQIMDGLLISISILFIGFTNQPHGKVSLRGLMNDLYWSDATYTQLQL